jgi:hypothetical protein
VCIFSVVPVKRICSNVNEEVTMPKFTAFQMSEDDYTKLESVARAQNLGGLCVAISLARLERINKDEPLPASSRGGEA